MKPQKIDQLLELIQELVDEEGKTWKEKRQEILDEIGEPTKASLEEFASWFDTTEV